MEVCVAISASHTITSRIAYRTGGFVTHAKLLHKLAVVAAAGLFALGLGAATATSASAAGPVIDIDNPTPYGDISDGPPQS